VHSATRIRSLVLYFFLRFLLVVLLFFVRIQIDGKLHLVNVQVPQISQVIELKKSTFSTRADRPCIDGAVCRGGFYIMMLVSRAVYGMTTTL